MYFQFNMKHFLFIILTFLYFTISAQNKLVYINPSDLGINGVVLIREIDKIMHKAIDSAAFPGAQILLAKDGKVFFHKAYGYHTYDSLRSVRLTDIYDLASVTKTTAATLALMKLYDQGLFDPNQTLGYYFPKVAKGKRKILS